MKKFALLLFIFAFSGGSAFPQVVNEILKRMDAHEKALRSFEADMTVTKSFAQSGETYKKEGRVRFLPGKTDFALRIDSTKPVLESFSTVLNQYVLYHPNPNPFYLPNKGVAYTGNLTVSQKNLLWIFQIIGNPPGETLKRDFTVEYKGQEKLTSKTTVWRLALLPKNAALYKKIDLWVDGNGMPLQSTLIENNGEQTTVLLEKLKKNERMSSRDFQIKLPKDTKIIKD